MDKFEETVKKAKEATFAAYKKTGEVLSVQKEKIEIVTLNNKLNDLYAALGKALIKREDIDFTNEQEIINNINLLLEQINTAKENINKIKCKEECPNCNKYIEKGLNFCPHCGYKL